MTRTHRPARIFTTTRCAAWRSRIAFGALVFSCGMAMAEAPLCGEPKADAQQSLAQLRAYLPLIRQKALLNNERDYVAELGRWHKRYALYVECGIADPMARGRVEEAHLRGIVEVLRREAEYRSSEEQFTRRFSVSVERRRQIEDTTVSTLMNLFKRFEALAHDEEAAHHELAKSGRDEGAEKLRPSEGAEKLRPSLVKLLTTIALVKNTALPKRFLKLWNEWEKVDDLQKLERFLFARHTAYNALSRL